MKYQNKIICDVPRKLDIGENHNMCTAMPCFNGNIWHVPNSI